MSDSCPFSIPFIQRRKCTSLSTAVTRSITSKSISTCSAIVQVTGDCELGSTCFTVEWCAYAAAKFCWNSEARARTRTTCSWSYHGSPTTSKLENVLTISELTNIVFSRLKQRHWPWEVLQIQNLVLGLRLCLLVMCRIQTWFQPMQVTLYQQIMKTMTVIYLNHQYQAIISKQQMRYFLF